MMGYCCYGLSPMTSFDEEIEAHGHGYGALCSCDDDEDDG